MSSILKRRATLLGLLDGTAAKLADENGAVDAIHADHLRSLTGSHAGIDPRLQSC